MSSSCTKSVLAKKTPGELEDEEAERLVRQLPKQKPPRYDRRRERLEADRDPDVDGDPDTKGDPDLSMNYKTIGGSVEERVARQFLSEAEEDSEFDKVVKNKTFRHPDTGNKVEFGSLPLEEQERIRAQFDKNRKSITKDVGSEGKSTQGRVLRELAKNNPSLQESFKSLLDPKSQLGGLAEGNPKLPASAILKGVKLPEGVSTIGDVVEALRASHPTKTDKKPKAKAPEKGEETSPKKEETPPPSEPSKEEDTHQKPTYEPQGPPKPDGKPDGKLPPKDDDTPQELPEVPRGVPQIPGPKRPSPTRQEIVEAMDLLLDTFPPEVAGHYYNLHPDDVHQLVSHYNKVKSLGPFDSSEAFQKELQTVASDFTFSPEGVRPPKRAKDKDGLEKPFDELTPEERSDAMQKHRIEAVAINLATRARAIQTFEHNGATPKLAAALTDFSLSSGKGSPEERAKKAKELSKKMFLESSTAGLPKTGESEDDFFDDDDDLEPDDEVDERFGTKQPEGKIRRTHMSDRRRLLATLDTLEDPHLKMLVVSHFQGEDYDEVREKFLAPGAMRRISEHESAKEIYKKLREASEFLTYRNNKYPEEIRRGLDDPASVFRTRVKHSLRTIDPDKAAAVEKAFAKLDDEEYRERLTDYKSAYKDYRKAYRDYENKHVEWLRGLAQYQEKNGEGKEGDPYRIAPPSGYDVPEPKSPVPPVRPEMPAGYLSRNNASGIDRSDTEKLIAEHRQRKASVLYSSYPWLNLQMGTSNSLESDKVAVYHGVDPYPEGHEGFSPYMGWQQAHQRDLGEEDFRSILTSAREWLRSTLLANQVDGLVPDARFRAALDLAIREVEGGRYSGAINVRIYNDLLAKLMGKSSQETLLTNHQASVQREGSEMTIKFAKEQANEAIGRLDRLAGLIESDYEKWGLSFKVAKHIVNEIDKSADLIETGSFGEDSLRKRQVEVLREAKLLGGDGDERKYMDTFDAPMAPIQTDRDEGYMSLFKDDQSSAVGNGKSETGRDLAPKY